MGWHPFAQEAQQPQHLLGTRCVLNYKEDKQGHGCSCHRRMGISIERAEGDQHG